MHLIRLSLSGFRNLRDQRLEFPSEGVAVLGRNAQGKTNLLEAIHYLETFRSFRGVRDDQLVRFGDEVFRVTAELGVGGTRANAQGEMGGVPGSETPPALVVGAAYEAGSRRKRITLDGDPVTRVGEAIGGLGVVLFSPDDVRLVTDGPGERRRFLDVTLSLNDPGYLAALRRFRQILLRRNAVLRRGEGPPAVAAWNGLLVEAGSQVVGARVRWIRDMNPYFAEYCAEVSGEGGARMRYVPGIRGGGGAPGGEEEVDLEGVASAYRAALQGTAELERRRQTTLEGPHRDEIQLLLATPEGERDARDFGSGGQRRTVALALRLVEAATIRRHRGKEPLLLLDDVFAELDEGRSARVLQLLDRLAAGQVIVTAPKEADVRFRGDRLPRWRMSEGEVTE